MPSWPSASTFFDLCIPIISHHASNSCFLDGVWWVLDPAAIVKVPNCILSQHHTEIRFSNWSASAKVHHHLQRNKWVFASLSRQTLNRVWALQKCKETVSFGNEEWTVCSSKADSQTFESVLVFPELLCSSFDLGTSIQGTFWMEAARQWRVHTLHNEVWKR